MKCSLLCTIKTLIHATGFYNNQLKHKEKKEGILTQSYDKSSYTNWKLKKANLRLCKTAITWLRSLSAILPLFWRHDIAELHRLCREDLRNVLWRHEKCDVFPRIMSCALQNMQFSQYFTTKYYIFSLNLTGESDFFILLISTHNKLSRSSF